MRLHRRCSTVLVVALAVLTVGHAQGERPTAAPGMAAFYPVIGPLIDVDRPETLGYTLEEPCRVVANGSTGDRYVRTTPTHGVVDVDPAVLVYEPRPNGARRLVAIGYRVDHDAWHANGTTEAPTLLGHPFTLDEPQVGSTGRTYGLTLWLVQFNPLGLTAEVNPLIGCARFGQLAGDSLP